MKKYKLGEIADVIGGVNFEPTDIEPNGIRILRGGNIQNHTISIKEDDVFLPAHYQDITNQVQVGDTIIVASTGSVEVLGKAATCFDEIPKTQIGAFLRLLRPKEPQFAMLISIAVNSEHFRKYIRAQAKGTSINNINLGHLKSYEFEAPANLESISTFYYNIETKMTLNRAINQNLEAMAKQLYDYWFVQFDFPNEEGKPYKSSGGEMVWNETLKRFIPKGWESTTLGNECQMYQPKTLGLSELDDNAKYKVYGANGVIGKYYIYNHENSEIAMACRGNSCGTVNRTAPFSWITGNAMVIKMIDDSIHNEYIKQALHYANVDGAISGSGQPQLTRENLNSIKLCKPTRELIIRFSEQVSNIVEMYLQNESNIEELTKQRDELLPLLMNGQVTPLNCD